MSEPGLDFQLGEMADTIRETTRRFADDKIAPIAAEIDEKDEFPRHLWPQMGELGLHGITVEEEDGGLGLGEGARDHVRRGGNAVARGEALEERLRSFQHRGLAARPAPRPPGASASSGPGESGRCREIGAPM